MYKTILEETIFEEEIKKSKFIGYVAPATTKDEAEAYIDKIKGMHREATHNCSAYIIGEEGLIQKYDDDGEPKKTAGPPILEVLKNRDLRNVVCVVTRYFGGTMLGAGGLIRAYSGTCSGALDQAQVVEMEWMKKIRVSYDYVFHGIIENYLLSGGFPIIDSEFTNKVTLSSILFQDLEKSFLQNLMDISSGGIEIVYNEDILLPTRGSELLWEGRTYEQERWI